nr:aldehyde dehydrogenase [Rhodococcus opacus]
MITYDKLFVDGWTAPSAPENIDVHSPGTGALIGQVPCADRPEVDAAVAAARRNFDDTDGWAGWDVERRATALERLADGLDGRHDDLVTRVCSQNGMPISLAHRLEGALPQAVYRYYAQLIRRQPSSELRQGFLQGTFSVQRRPIGLIGAIVPWNYPQVLLAFKVAPALAAGCTVVAKLSPETVLDSYVFAEAVQAAGIPDGVVNLLPAGADIGAYLVEHPGIDKVAFTGSTATGRIIGETCGRLLRPVTLELGGKSAAIVLDDADLAANAAGIYASSFLNNGQTCAAATRILAPASRYEEVVNVIAGLADSLVVGDALDPATQVGPLVSRKQRDRVEAHIARALADGARLVAGGDRPKDLDGGWFVRPTVFADVDNRSALAREEVFGPVVAITPYTDVDHAIALANDSDYGLGGVVWTSDPDRGQRVAARVQTGTIGVNAYTLDPAAPFGGIKDSGIGRELGPEGLAAYQSVQSMFLPTGG